MYLSHRLYNFLLCLGVGCRTVCCNFLLVRCSICNLYCTSIKSINEIQSFSFILLFLYFLHHFLTWYQSFYIIHNQGMTYSFYFRINLKSILNEQKNENLFAWISITFSMHPNCKTIASNLIMPPKQMQTMFK